MAQSPKLSSRRSAADPTTDPALAARDMLRGTIQRRKHALSMFRRLAANDPPIERVIAEALDLAHNSLRVSRCAYAARGIGEGAFRLTSGIGWDPDVIGRSVLRGDPGSMAAQTELVGRPVIIEDLRLFQAFGAEPVLMACGTRSTLTAPVRGQRGVVGLLGVFSSERRLFTPDEAEFVWGLAGVIAAALYREEWRNRARIRELTSHGSHPV